MSRRRLWLAGALLACGFGACASPRAVSRQHLEAVERGRCEPSGAPMGMVLARLEGAALGAPLSGLVVTHVDSGRSFTLLPGRVHAMLPAGKYRVDTWWAVLQAAEGDRIYEGEVAPHDVPEVVAGRVVSWGRYRLVDTEGGGVALTQADLVEARVEGDELVVRWEAGMEPVRYPAAACLSAGTEEGGARPDTARIEGVVTELHAGVAIPTGDLRRYGSLLRVDPARPSGDLAGPGAGLELGVGWTLGWAGYPIHEVAVTFSWLGHELTSEGKSLADPLAGPDPGRLVGLHIGVMYVLRPFDRWIVSPIVGVGTGATVADLGTDGASDSDPDVAWLGRVQAGLDVRPTEEVGIRVKYDLYGALAGAALPLAHTVTVGVAVVVGSDLRW